MPAVCPERVSPDREGGDLRNLRPSKVSQTGLQEFLRGRDIELAGASSAPDMRADRQSVGRGRWLSVRSAIGLYVNCVIYISIMPEMQNFALRIYRRLAEAFPHEFKLVYGKDVVQLGEDVVEEIAKKHGLAGLIRLVADIAIRVPAEYLSEMRGDLRYAVRGLMQSPGFALVGIVSLGLGMGVTTSVFSRLWTQLFQALPAVEKPAELVMPQNPV